MQIETVIAFYPTFATIYSLKHLGAIVNLRPESMLEQLAGLSKILGRAELVQMRKYAHHLGKAMRLQDVQELKRFHLKAKLGIDAQEDEVGDLGAIQHGGRIVGTFHQRDALLLPRNDRDGPNDVGEVVVGVHLDQASNQRRFAHALGSHHHHEGRRGLDLLGTTVLQRHILLLLRFVQVALNGSLRPNDVGHRKGSVVVPIGPGVVGLGPLVLLLFLGTPSRLGLVVTAVDLVVPGVRHG